MYTASQVMGIFQKAFSCGTRGRKFDILYIKYFLYTRKSL